MRLGDDPYVFQQAEAAILKFDDQAGAGGERTGRGLQNASALPGLIIAGILLVPGHAALKAAAPPPVPSTVGEALYFATDGRDLVTSPLEAVERPSKELVEAYPNVNR